ncbi:M23 family metallopeptidase [Brachybacterium vulturis]|uniref:M23 family metallopeptidase n=1 Tax=Brachybacterium vulturis TaxID=2017484 RepID=UPI003735C11F
MSPSPAPALPSFPLPRHPCPGTGRRARVLRVPALLLVLVALVSLPGHARADEPRWRWPLPPPHPVIAPFQAPEHRYGPGHRGIDIAVPADGAAVRAVAAGTVRFSGMVAGRGVVSVTHADGLISTYEPVHGALEAGGSVEAGEVLGTLADTGVSHCPGSACLHLGARRGAGYLDPLLLLGAHGPSVLLPWDEPSTGAGPAAAAGSVAPPAGELLSTAAARTLDSALAAAVPAPAVPLR